MERLQKIIAESGYCSRRKAEELITSGRVKVNGQVIDELGFKANYDDDIKIDDVSIQKQEKVVYILNKPKNVISSVSDDRGRSCVSDLIETDYRLYPIGRLDYDSTGLLLLSNDGELTQKMIHPKYEVQKTYEVTINGLIKENEIAKLENGVKIDDYVSSKAEIKLIKQNTNKYISFLTITIHEGRNREVRKMFSSLGYKVIKLHRISEANIELGNLRPGEYRRLKPIELVKLKKYLDSNDR